MVRKLSGFAEACYDQNTFGDLIDSLLERTADKTDCTTWKISAADWREAIGEALRAKVQNYAELNSRGHGRDIDRGAEAATGTAAAADMALRSGDLLPRPSPLD